MDVVRRPRRLVAALAVLPLAVALGGCAKENDDRAADPSTAGGSTDVAGAGPVPSDEQWCTLWREMAAAQAAFAVSVEGNNQDLLLAAVERLEDAGYPAAMSEDARHELDLILNDVHAAADPSWTPPPDETALPSQGFDPGEDAPFATYLDENCPA